VQVKAKQMIFLLVIQKNKHLKHILHLECRKTYAKLVGGG